MFAVIYSFKVNPGMEQSFIQAWNHLTKLILEHEKSLGSRLHIASGGFIAYAQWPSSDKYFNAGRKLPPEAEFWRTQMRECCSEITTLNEMEIVDDLLVPLKNK